jgi:hypothetical protein
MGVRCGMWDVRSLYRAGLLVTVAGEKARNIETTRKF